ncbi:MAG: hypothetical protein J5X21_15350 [Candidatus Accumulibacter sp.]|nr:hypothetical protein [Candidatus Accumulibacter conexus]
MLEIIPSGRNWQFNTVAFIEQRSSQEYIDPQYLIENKNELRSSPYLIISAPGAVGKSAFGKYLSNTKNAMLWDLAKLRLGSNTFIGSIIEAVGPQQLTDFLDSIRKGHTTLVFDALDEAELHSGWSGVQSFIKDVITYTSEAIPASVVFLARRDTAELLEVALSELLSENRMFSTAKIGFFSKSAATKFILAQVKHHKGAEFLTKNQKIIERKAIEAISMSIFDEQPIASLDDWRSNEQERFFGYAPVLQTIARLISDSDNPYTLSFQQTGSRYSSIVSNILSIILNREQSKLIEAAKQRFAPDTVDSVRNAIYTGDDQQNRILSLMVGDTSAAYAIPATIQADVARTLSDMIRGFLPQHPFLNGNEFAGPAFRDYILANGLLSSDARLACEIWIDTNRPLFTPIFAGVYATRGVGEANSDDIEILYESANAGAVTSQSSLYLYVSADDASRISVEISSDESDPLGEHLVFRAPRTETIIFNRHLNNAHIVFDGTLRLGNRDQEFEVTESEVIAKEIRLESNHIRVRSTKKNASHLEAESATWPAILRIETTSDDLLTVSWPHSTSFPWTHYSSESAVAKSVVDANTTLHVVARILGWFRKDRREEYGRYRDLIVKHVVGQSPTARHALGYLNSIGALYERGNLYFIDSDVLDKHEVSWQKIRSGTVSPTVILSVEQYLRTNPNPPQF